MPARRGRDSLARCGREVSSPGRRLAAFTRAAQTRLQLASQLLERLRECERAHAHERLTAASGPLLGALLAGLMGVGIGFGGILCLKGYVDMVTGTNKKPV